MIIVQGWVRLASAEETERRLVAAVEMMRATTAEESGCLAYAYASDLADAALLHVVERWRDEAALNGHLATPHMAVFGQAMADARPSRGLSRARNRAAGRSPDQTGRARTPLAAPGAPWMAARRNVYAAVGTADGTNCGRKET